MSIIREIPKLNPTLEHFLEHTRHKTYDARSMIIHEGDVSKCLYYIIEGSVSVLAENESGDEIILAHLNEGDFFGEAGLFEFDHNEPGKRTACVFAPLR
jgi:CRP/FNR family cyclic AMP-dependent transcriptional regulator